MQSELNQAYRGIGNRSVSQIHKLLQMLRPHQTGHPLIRIGPDYDGGYVLPDDLDGIAASFSPGVDDVLGFDLEIASMGIPTHLIDASVAPPKGLRDNMTFTQKFVGPETGGQFVTIDDWVNTHAPGTGDLLLQMDIESAEYDVLPAMSETLLKRCRIIIIEFHDLHRTIDPVMFDKVKTSWERLAKGHTVAHAHINNCAQTLELKGLSIPTVVEVTYIRNDRIQCNDCGEATVPHPLDQLNNPILPIPSRAKFWSRA